MLDKVKYIQKLEKIRSEMLISRVALCKLIGLIPRTLQIFMDKNSKVPHWPRTMIKVRDFIEKYETEHGKVK